ncbi:hypothetical protein AVT43_gp80 [Polaribacter phage P12002L]|uniref:Uncharacterized protein n=2 Tax=Incheonvirus TaxID=2976977 RepID=A0A0F7IK29_9CAUD|nr:hypothetical protein AVT42_gp82 [Polaribacter phage P12002S]YP_009209740.1 hypothetical protein AVT43_gp80 [Polaribacter phage P12002L]AKG94254.1 hypothetical protein P12002L_0080 [Polaribacter phage P12002L]AKG94338.1 hypothetical protein P12002S_0082 [Polaribacter phage P12002S]
MTIDKIKYYMNPIIFNYWISNVPTQKDINKAYNDLKKEIDSGLLKGVKYHAELNLLKSKLSF